MTELRKRWEREKADLRAGGRVEGRFEGRFEGRAESILALMKARGVAISEPVKLRVLGCKDIGLRERWLVRAATASSDIEVIAA